jgi:ubiquinone/menaquinone biosynthesis C-methylase UbiE
VNAPRRKPLLENTPLPPAPRPSKPKPQSASTDWNHVAAWYDQLVGTSGNDYHQQVIAPALKRLLEIVPSGKVLDVCCGQGVMSRYLRALAYDVTGMDAAPDLISAARQRETELEKGQKKITYLLGDARELRHNPQLPAAGFDAAICVLAIQNLTPLSPLWEGLAHVLKPRACAVIVLMHPCFRIPRRTGWGWDEKTNSQYRRVDTYMTSEKTGIVMHPGSDPTQTTTTTYHRPLQAYINTMAEHGLFTDRMEELVSHRQPPRGKRFDALDQSRREIPLFVALRVRKIAI